MGMMKRTVSFLLVLLLLVGLVPAASAAGVWHSGDCGAVGSNVTWSLYTDGALVISGSGAMEDYYLNDINYGYMTSTAPWYEWEMYITSVRVEDGITRVGDYAFHNLWWVETVELGADVKTIGAYAFFGLGNLKTVTIPNNVASIGEYAFAECSAVSELDLGSGVTTIGEGAFYYCGALEKVDIPNSVKTLGNNAFDSCYNVTSLNIGTGVKALPVAVFSGLNKLSSVTIPGNVKSIGRLAFHGCKALKEVALSEGVQVLLERAFSECALETIYFPASVSSIGALAFADCGALSLAIFNGDAPAVAEDAFSGCAPEFVINYPAPGRGWATPVWNGYPAYPFDPFGTLPETWPVNIGAHVVTVASTRLGQDGKMTPLKGATVQILTKSGTIHTGTTDENGQYAYHNNDGKELRISADGYQLLRAIYPMNTGESRIFTLDPLPADGAPYFSMLCELTELAFYDAADPFRHIRAEADRFAPGAFYEQRPICAAISYRYKGDPSAQIYNSEPVRLKLFIDPKPGVVKPGESNAVNTAALIPGFGATCTEAGLTDGAHCAECGEILTAQKEIPALGHDWRSTDCIRCDATRSNPFRDVPADSFYIDPVLWAVERGITTGTSATTFDPNGQCMRAVVVTFLWRAAGEPEPASSNNPFRDVKESDFFYKAVLWAVEKGITNGLEAGRFGPYDYCNRAQVVTFLYRAMGKPAVKDPYNPFTDVPAGSFYHMPVIWAVEQGITNGISAASFGSDAVCNRAQIVTFLFRAMG